MAQSDGAHNDVYRALPDSDPSVEKLDLMETEVEYLNMDESEVDGEETEDHWDPMSIRQMLTLYINQKHRFADPKVRKKNIWIEIGLNLGKTANTCDKKFRNLKMTYLRLLRKRKNAGETTIKWPYFDMFEEIYTNDGSYNPEIELKLLDESRDRVPRKRERELDDSGETRQRKRLDVRTFMHDMQARQRSVENKLDRLIAVVEESNNIQKERNKLFQRFLDSMEHT